MRCRWAVNRRPQVLGGGAAGCESSAAAAPCARDWPAAGADLVYDAGELGLEAPGSRPLDAHSSPRNACEYSATTPA